MRGSISTVLVIGNILAEQSSLDDIYSQATRVSWLNRHKYRRSTLHIDMIRHLVNMSVWSFGPAILALYAIKSTFHSITFKIKSITRYNFFLKEDKMSKFAHHCLMVNKLISI